MSKISEIGYNDKEPKENWYDVEATVIHVDHKNGTKNGRDWEQTKCLLEDDSGQITYTIWSDAKVNAGDVLKLENVVSEEWNNEVGLKHTPKTSSKIVGQNKVSKPKTKPKDDRKLYVVMDETDLIAEWKTEENGAIRGHLENLIILKRIDESIEKLHVTMALIHAELAAK